MLIQREARWKASDNSLCHLCNSSVNLQLFQRKVSVKYKGHHITAICEILRCLLTPEAEAEPFILAYQVHHNLAPGQLPPPPLLLPLLPFPSGLDPGLGRLCLLGSPHVFVASCDSAQGPRGLCLHPGSCPLYNTCFIFPHWLQGFFFL